MKMLQAIMAANNLSYSTILDFIKLLNVVLGEKTLPESIYYFKKVCSSKIDFIKEYFCKKCAMPIENNNITHFKCSSCQCTEKDYFISVPIKNKLEKIIKTNFDDITSYKEYLKKQNPGIINDINNSSWYKSIEGIEGIGDFFTININTDGVAPFNASKKNLFGLY